MNTKHKALIIIGAILLIYILTLLGVWQIRELVLPLPLWIS